MEGVIVFQEALAFDDVLLVPQYSTVESRRNISLKTQIASVGLEIPILSANMTTVTGAEMAAVMSVKGGLGVVHRMQPIQEQANMITDVRFGLLEERTDCQIGFAFGLDDWQERVHSCMNAGANIAFLDVAHADQFRVVEFIIAWYHNPNRWATPLIVGNIATKHAAEYLVNFVPKEARKYFGLKIGIGGGSMCTTRIQTGAGMPTFQSVYEIAQAGVDVTLIADGGIKNSGDIVKALAAGADAVMCGALFAGTAETPGSVIKDNRGQKYKIYRGSASYADKFNRGDPNFIEGEESLVPYKGSVVYVLDQLIDGVRSGFSYVGADTLEKLHARAQFVKITPSGLRESRPHGLTT